MKVYITKYALTCGIQEKEVEDYGDGTVGLSDGSAGRNYFHGEGRQWHRTIESAIEKAEDMRRKKIRSLNNALDKLKELKFK